MGGFFGVDSKGDCVQDLFYGTDYHSHLGTKRGGLAVANSGGILRYIHNIENAQFRSKFEDDVQKLHGTSGQLTGDESEWPTSVAEDQGLGHLGRAIARQVNVDVETLRPGVGRLPGDAPE